MEKIVPRAVIGVSLAAFVANLITGRCSPPYCASDYCAAVYCPSAYSEPPDPHEPILNDAAMMTTASGAPHR